MIKQTFSWQEFFSTYWHKEPVIIKQAFKGFVDPLSADELAGFSMEPEVDSRLIFNDESNWKVSHGPFEEKQLTSLPESHWQLVVQAVNHWHDAFAPLLSHFSSLPNWLFDDLMVCYSAMGGGVGPHIDQYDVFILQGEGKRRWKVGAKDVGQYDEVIQDGALRQISGFEPIIDEEVTCGDLLYIPPGFPHCGDTLSASLSYSIGYRSPKQQELLSHFADYVIESSQGLTHLHDPSMQPQVSHHHISESAVDKLTAMLLAQFEDKNNLNHFLGQYLSQSRHHLDIVPPDSPIDLSQLRSDLQQGLTANKVLGLKVLTIENQTDYLYVDGEKFAIRGVSVHFVTALTTNAKLP
ncbi:cupin domain-containing protein [Vibrio sonorensis]|uniref:cupin domain-containing protein n=1 Tax=Vibrio sonorensis TaxID=1004316 RepID=UPI000A968120|nr:cupin domain-containing protein [Vibrio sonorensis]